MARYFFHMEDHVILHDSEGLELANDVEARAEAVRRLATAISARPEDVWDGTRWRVKVAGEAGRILWSLELHAEKGASVVPWTRRA